MEKFYLLIYQYFDLWKTTQKNSKAATHKFQMLSGKFLIWVQHIFWKIPNLRSLSIEVRITISLVEALDTADEFSWLLNHMFCHSSVQMRSIIYHFRIFEIHLALFLWVSKKRKLNSFSNISTFRTFDAKFNLQ